MLLLPFDSIYDFKFSSCIFGEPSVFHFHCVTYRKYVCMHAQNSVGTFTQQITLITQGDCMPVLVLLLTQVVSKAGL